MNIEDLREKREDIENDISEIKEKRDHLKSEMDNKKNKYRKINEQIYEIKDDMVKVVCPSCGGKGFIPKQGKSNRQRPCPTCDSNGYEWAKKYE